MKPNTGEHIAIFGASRGLGRAVASFIESDSRLLLSSRKIEKHVYAQTLQADLTLEADQDRVLETLANFGPQRVFYFAGGGPHGPFAEKNWRDHMWAAQLNYLFPAKLLHTLLKDKNLKLKQIIITGSAIAESKADPGAASYSAAKHALLGLMKSLWQEKYPIDIRLFSPGYMDTQMLPKGAWPRESGKMKSPEVVAQDFLKWASDDKGVAHFLDI